MADQQDNFEMVDVTDEMEPILRTQEAEQEEKTKQTPMIEPVSQHRERRKHRKHHKKHRKRRRRKHHSHGKHRSRRKRSSRSPSESKEEEQEGGEEHQGADQVSIPSDSQVAAAPNKEGVNSNVDMNDFVYLPGSTGQTGEAAPVAGVGPSNTTTSITTIVERSKDPAVIVERIKQFLICFPEHENKKPADYAVVFDIDETLLYTLQDEVGLQPVGHALYRFCVDQGFVVELVTARVGDPHGLQYLQEQLHALEYTGYHAISMVNTEHKHDDSPALCKLRSRLDIRKPVILNVGNRVSDLFLTPEEDDCLLNQINGQTYYCFKGQDPDILCVKLPTD
jgi:hypothetical protein